MVMTEARNATLSDLGDLLKDQQARKVDVVAPASSIKMDGGTLVVAGADAVLTEDGVTKTDGRYRATDVFDEGLAQKLNIPLAYVRRMRSERPDMLDANVNGWLQGRRRRLVGGRWNAEAESYDRIPGKEHLYRSEPAIPGDDRSFLIRTFKPDDEQAEGIARAFLSDRYRVVDNLDCLTAALDGVRQAGTEVVIDSADLTERRMTVRLLAPEIQALAGRLLQGYRTPFEDIERWRQVADREGMSYGGEEPIVYAGLVLSNSETGGGAFTITPRFTVKVCKNGLTITKDVLRSVHLGGRLEEGVIEWSDATQAKSVELIRAKTADAVRTFLDVDYMERVLDRMTEDAERPVKTEEVKTIAKRLTFTEEQQNAVLDHFVRGGQTTRGGVMQAVSAVAQIQANADVAYDMEAKAVAALTA